LDTKYSAPEEEVVKKDATRARANQNFFTLRGLKRVPKTLKKCMKEWMRLLKSTQV
jgi:hypothetical protein